MAVTGGGVGKAGGGDGGGSGGAFGGGDGADQVVLNGSARG